ncbi:magnesium/cobalt transporter CorA [Mucilaginibacter antarcticus]|uniref:Magnesium transport protein CorA n=1 Tax=Mucilaginibacter antarcticus TaxID=1855725 RepID=A0ABW5XUH8_9SPHI
MSHIKRVHRKKVNRNVGDRPGVFVISADALKPVIHVYSYNEKEVVIDKGHDIKIVLAQLKKCKDHTHWIQIQGLGDANLINDIGEHLNINPLVLEDIVNTHQRPKFDEYDDYVFSVSRQLFISDGGELHNKQFSALVKSNLIISFEETYIKTFDVVKTRLQAGKGVIRAAGPGYLCYALSDVIIDNYFVLLAKIGDDLDDLEDRLYKHADKTIMYDAQQLKRSLIALRRVTWPERDKLNDILRTDNPYVTAEVKMYLRDAYDHCIQVMDMIENYKEISNSVIDLYLSMVSNRMNEIMKVLTIISAIFIPLTFVAGIYGMNFAKVDPVSNKAMPDNMPELYSPHGYYWALAGMSVIALIQVVIFWKKGWFTKL